MFKDNEILLKALSDVYSENTELLLNSLSDDGYEYSKKHNRKIQKIIKRQRRPYSSFMNNAVKYAICAAASVIIITGSFATVSAFYEPLHDFIVSIFSDNTKVTVSNIGNAPTEINEFYEISSIPDGFNINYQVTEKQITSALYSSSENYIYFGQYVKSVYKDIEFDNSEFYIDENKQEFLISEIEEDGYCVIWDNGDYVLHINSNLPKEEILEICKSVKLKEDN